MLIHLLFQINSHLHQEAVQIINCVCVERRKRSKRPSGEHDWRLNTEASDHDWKHLILTVPQAVNLRTKTVIRKAKRNLSYSERGDVQSCWRRETRRPGRTLFSIYECKVIQQEDGLYQEL